MCLIYIERRDRHELYMNRCMQPVTKYNPLSSMDPPHPDSPSYPPRPISGTRVYVKLDPGFRRRVSGLCGNFDGDTENDFTSRQGIIEPTADLFGNSWRMSLLCPEVHSDDFEHPCMVWGPFHLTSGVI